VTAPASETGYAHFHHGSVRCDDGTSVATGPLTMGCDHAAVNLSTPGARDHYANTGLAFADVRATNGALGVWVSGVLRPGVTDDQVRILRASSLSGDWRKEQVGNTTNFEFIGALAVNVPGFPIVREALTAAGVGAMPQAAVTATGGFTDGVQTALTAAGIVHRCPTCQQQALASLGYGPPETPVSWEADETLRLLRTLEMRTRHLRGAAAEHAMGQIRPRR
jgi:hypothetical protein